MTWKNNANEVNSSYSQGKKKIHLSVKNKKEETRQAERAGSWVELAYQVACKDLSPSTAFTRHTSAHSWSQHPRGRGSLHHHPKNLRPARAPGDPASKTKRNKAGKGQGSGHLTPWTPRTQLPRRQCSCTIQVTALSDTPEEPSLVMQTLIPAPGKGGFTSPKPIWSSDFKDSQGNFLKVRGTQFRGRTLAWYVWDPRFKPHCGGKSTNQPTNQWTNPMKNQPNQSNQSTTPTKQPNNQWINPTNQTN